MGKSAFATLSTAALLGSLSGLARAQSFVQPTNAAGEAALTDPTQECTPYYNVAPFDTMVSLFPPVWTIASILPSDTFAQNLYNQIAPGIPNIPQRGTPLYDPQPWLANYSSSDPDCWWTYHQCTVPKLAGLPPDIQACSTPNTYGTAFDDGPNCTHNEFYQFLRDNHIKADMFYIGSNLLDWPLQGQAAFNDGHIVCAHTWSHRAMCSLNNTAVFAELYYSMLAIKNILGVIPHCWRPPFGDVDDRVRYIANALGLQTIMWNENTNDFYVYTLGPNVINQNYENIIALQQKGTYGDLGVAIEAHELNNATMQLFANNYLGIEGAFQHVEPIHVCNNITQPYYEAEYTYPNHAQYAAGTSTLMAFTASASSISALTQIAALASVSGVTAGTYSYYSPPSPTSTPPSVPLPTVAGEAPDAGLIVDPSTQPAAAATNAPASSNTQNAAVQSTQGTKKSAAMTTSTVPRALTGALVALAVGFVAYSV